MPRIAKQIRTPAHVAAITRELARCYDVPSRPTPRRELLWQLILTVLSCQTHREGYTAAYRDLRRTFRSVGSLSQAGPARIADVIRAAGLARVKAGYICGIVQALRKRFGKATLAPLVAMDTREAEETLLALPGVGRKVARCLLLFSLGHRVFPVDTHCWRIGRRIGWIQPLRGSGSCSPSEMDRYQEMIPDHLRYQLHVGLVAHGRQTCTARTPACTRCCIARYCKRTGL
jgi:endonuclease III